MLWKEMTWVLGVFAGSLVIGQRSARSEAAATRTADASDRGHLPSGDRRVVFPRGYLRSLSPHGPESSPKEPLCAGGAESPLHAELMPTAMVTSGSASTLELDLEVKSGFDRDMRFATGVEIVDDRGNAMQKPMISTASRLAPAKQVSTALRTPPGLAAGYYVVRATLTAESDDQTERETQVAELFLQVDAAGISPISMDEWYQKSRANQGVRFL